MPPTNPRMTTIISANATLRAPRCGVGGYACAICPSFTRCPDSPPLWGIPGLALPENKVKAHGIPVSQHPALDRELIRESQVEKDVIPVPGLMRVGEDLEFTFAVRV